MTSQGPWIAWNVSWALAEQENAACIIWKSGSPDVYREWGHTVIPVALAANAEAMREMLKDEEFSAGEYEDRCPTCWGQKEHAALCRRARLLEETK